MNIKITKHAQSCFEIEAGKTRILIDPGRFVSEKEGLNVNNFKKPDIFFISHNHGDHYVQEIAQEIIELYDPYIITTPDIKEELLKYSKKFINEKTFQIDELELTVFQQQHGKPDSGNSAPETVGIYIKDGEKTVYFTADTISIDKTADIIMVAISGHGAVFDIDQAKDEMLKLKPKIAIPMHYDTKYPIDVNDFSKAMEGTGIEVKVLKNGESLVI